MGASGLQLASRSLKRFRQKAACPGGFFVRDLRVKTGCFYAKE
jgi:hypothetical protein